MSVIRSRVSIYSPLEFHDTAHYKSMYDWGMGELLAMLASCCRLLVRSWVAMIAATGTSTLGFFVWTLAVTVVGWLAPVVAEYIKLRERHIPNLLEQSLANSWFSGVLTLAGVGVLLFLAWAVFTV